MIIKLLFSIWPLLLMVGLLALTTLCYGIYLIFKLNKCPKVSTTNAEEVTGIAGEDVISTQLDLARAYIETGNKQLAKNLLTEVAIQGSTAQKNEARNLLGLI